MSVTVGTAQEILAATAALTARDRALIVASGGKAMEPSDQAGALLDAVRALGEAGIPFALIGGIAVGIRAGVPRATMDVDLAVSTSVPRGRVTEVLQTAGFELRGEYAHSVNFRSEDGEPVQAAFDAAFDAAIVRADPVVVGELDVPVVRTDDLIAMKQRAAEDPSRRRSKALRDLADVELLRGEELEDDGW